MHSVSDMQPIDRMTAADSVLALLGRLDVQKFPTDERMAVALVEIEAIDEWFAAYLDVAVPSGRRVPRSS
jgi:hypothetical protein